MISAHFDHDGANGTQIMNGADDDGSGTVGLLEIAEAYALAAKAGQRPRRSILFAAFNSEERGLLGAWAYTLQPIAPLDKIVAVLNMDMIGRNEEVPRARSGRRPAAARRRRPLQRPRSADRRLQRQRAEHHRLGAQPRSEGARSRRANEAAQRARHPVSLRQQRLAAHAAQRSVAVHPERRARHLDLHRPASRLPHASTTIRIGSTT